MTAGPMRARCPAKVNLVLRVLGRRDDGYHELDTVFQAIDLWDEIEIAPNDGLQLVCDRPGVPTDASNLVLRAAIALRERAGLAPVGARLTLRKTIPVQGGLGGGSSDAAGALLLCRRFWDLGVSDETLEEIGASLGADVPFFLHGGTARGRGRGDRIEPLPFAGKLSILLGVPPFGVSTAEVFSRLRGRLTPSANGVSLRILPAHKWQEENDFSVMANDLEPVVFELRPELGEFRDALLRAGARRALVSGSGSSVFGIFGSGELRDGASGGLARAFPGWTLVNTRASGKAAHVATR